MRSCSIHRAFVGLVLAALVWASPSLALSVGDTAPAFDVPETDGGNVALADHAGKVILLNFWASWCEPCKEELPQIEQEIHQVYGPDRFTAIALNKFDDLITIGLYKHTLLGVDFSFPFGQDEDGSVTAAYDAENLPHNFVIDHEGVVQYIEFGFTKAAVIAKIEELLEGVAVQSTSWSSIKAQQAR